MRVPFSELPGRHERHFQRRLQNPLFAEPAEAIDDHLLEMQRLDHEELLTFISELRQVVQRAVEMAPREETEVVLKLKEDLERLYEISAGLGDDQSGNQQAIGQLLAVVMRGVAANTDGDALASEELQMEAQARAMHFELLRHALVADLLHPQSVVQPGQLAATLLSESPEQVEAALTLFDASQVQQLAAEGQALLERHDPGRNKAVAWQCLALLRGR